MSLATVTPPKATLHRIPTLVLTTTPTLQQNLQTNRVTLIMMVKLALSSPDADIATRAADAEATTLKLSVVGNSFQCNHSSIYSLGHTPIKTIPLLHNLQGYHNHQFLAQGFTFGFRLQYLGQRGARESPNLSSVLSNTAIAQEKINKELALHRIAGPFRTPPLPNLQVSPIGLVPKKDGDMRLIHHLSYPDGNSINDFIDQSACTVQYSGIDDAASFIALLGRGCLLAKSDIKSAFRLIPIHPADFELLGFKFQGLYYFDKMLPFGASISCSLWNHFADFLHWVTNQFSKNPFIIHYLDDFLFCGPPLSSQCATTLQTFRTMCSELGVPIAEGKMVEPTTHLVFLGISFNTLNMTMSLPPEKLHTLREAIQAVLQAKKVTLKQLQSLLGLLNFACRVVAPGRAFCRRIIDSTVGVKKQHHKIRVTINMKHDLLVWTQFLQHYNGISVINITPLDDYSIQLFTDSAGGEKGGFGVYFNGKWAWGVWPTHWSTLGITRDMTFLELFPVIVALTLWHQHFQNTKLLLHIDNMSVVHIINNSTSKSPRVMSLVRKLVLLTLQHNIQVHATHIPTKLNYIAYSISRSQWARFRRLAPGAEQQPTPVPHHLWNI